MGRSNRATKRARSTTSPASQDVSQGDGNEEAFPAVDEEGLAETEVELRMPERLEAFNTACYRAMWIEGLNMADPEVFVEAMTKAGFDGADLLARTQDPAIKQKLMKNTAAAVERGAFGMPTFYAGDEMFYGKERLGQLEELLNT